VLKLVEREPRVHLFVLRILIFAHLVHRALFLRVLLLVQMLQRLLVGLQTLSRTFDVVKGYVASLHRVCALDLAQLQLNLGKLEIYTRKQLDTLRAAIATHASQVEVLLLQGKLTSIVENDRHLGRNHLGIF